jgi:hypothetical protein
MAEAKRTAATRERELDIEAYNAETNRLKVTGANVDQIEAVTRDLITQMLQQPEPLPGDAPANPQSIPEEPDAGGQVALPPGGAVPDDQSASQPDSGAMPPTDIQQGP